MKHTIIHISWLLLLLTACKSELLPPDQYLQWAAQADNGLAVNRQIGPFMYTAKFLPIALQVLDQAEKPFSKAKLNQQIKARLGDLRFQFKIQTLDQAIPVLKYGIQDTESYQARMNYLVGQMKNDLYLIRDADTVRASLFHFEQTYDLAPYVSCLVSFADQQQPYTEQVLVFNDTHFGGGPIKFAFPQQTLSTLPQLKLQ